MSLSRPLPTSLACWSAANGDIPRLDREVLAAHALQVSRAKVVARPETTLSAEQGRTLNRLAARRRRQEPLAHILGEKEFFGLSFKVDRRVLAPRPETELLVETLLRKAKPGERVLDLGTGSGCIAIAVKTERPDLQVTASDLSADALAVAADNAQRHKAKVRFVQSDWFSALANEFDAILTNPPYVADGDAALGELRFEPKMALAGGATGLDALEAVIGQAGAHLRPGAWLGLEHGHDQAAAVAALLERHGFERIANQRDLAAHPRLTTAHKPLGAICQDQTSCAR